MICTVIKNRQRALKGIYDHDLWAESSVEIADFIEKCGGRFHITGLENIAKADGPVVYVSNHMSTLETMVFPGIIAPQKRVTFVVKDTLTTDFLFGPVMRSRNTIVVGRSDSRHDLQTVMNEGQKRLSEGISVIIFPQSHRKAQFVPKEFNSLGVKLARAAKVPVVPVAIKTDFWGNGKYMKEMGPISRNKPINMHFGEPMHIDGNGKHEHEMVVDFIESKLKEWGHQ